jgi:hypothetical protein
VTQGDKTRGTVYEILARLTPDATKASVDSKPQRGASRFERLVERAEEQRLHQWATRVLRGCRATAASPDRKGYGKSPGTGFIALGAESGPGIESERLMTRAFTPHHP